MNAKIPVFVLCSEAIIYLLLHNLHDCTFMTKTNSHFAVKFVETSNHPFSAYLKTHLVQKTFAIQWTYKTFIGFVKTNQK